MVGGSGPATDGAEILGLVAMGSVALAELLGTHTVADNPAAINETNVTRPWREGKTRDIGGALFLEIRQKLRLNSRLHI